MHVEKFPVLGSYWFVLTIRTGMVLHNRELGH